MRFAPVRRWKSAAVPLKGLMAFVLLGFLLAACGTGGDPVLVQQSPTSASSSTTTTTTTIETIAVVETTLPSLDVGGFAPVSTVPVDTRPIVIYDTDMGPDVDDVLALAILHNYAGQGLIEIGAITVSRNSVPGARYADVVNTFYGRPDIPIGIHKSSYVKFDDSTLFTAKADSWSHELDTAGLEDGFKVQRRVIADALEAERDVIVVQTGFSGNLADLLKSEADDISDLNGIDLVAEAVSVLSIMAGSIERNMVEFNVERDIGSARYLFWKWPTKLVLSPFELGDQLHYPYSSITSDYNWVDRHPVREAYEYKNLTWHRQVPPYYDMKSWDLTSVMWAVEQDSPRFKISEAGLVTVGEDGRTAFRPGEGNGQRQDYVLDRSNEYSEQERQAIIDEMVDLVSFQPQPDLERDPAPDPADQDSE